jgi:hypothetical protein
MAIARRRLREAARQALEFLDHPSPLRIVEILREVTVVSKIVDVHQLVQPTKPGESLTSPPPALEVREEHVGRAAHHRGHEQQREAERARRRAKGDERDEQGLPRRRSEVGAGSSVAAAGHTASSTY